MLIGWPAWQHFQTFPTVPVGNFNGSNKSKMFGKNDIAW